MSEDRYLPGPPVANRGILVTVFACVATALLAMASLRALDIEFQPLSMALAAIISGMLLFTSVMLWSLRQQTKFYAETDVALAALGRGELERAAEIWSVWEARVGPEQVRAQAAHNLGWTVIRQGDPRRALTILGVNDLSRRKGLQSTHLAATTAQDLALCYVLIGDPEAAQAWFDESERRVTPKAPETFAAVRAFTRALIDCRAGRSKEAARELREHWDEFEAVPPPLLRILRVVRAFATSAASPRDAAKLVGSIRPEFPREYAFLGVEWPEMAAFLATHDLAAKTA